MAKDINIFSPKWRELIFEDKNQEYGAYKLRKNSSRYHIIAFLIIIAAAIVVSSLPKLISLLEFNKVEIDDSRVVELSNINDKPNEEENIQNLNNALPPPPAIKSSIKFTAPVITEDSKVNDADEMKTQDELTKSTAAISIKDVHGTDDGSGEDIRDVEEANLIGQRVREEEAVKVFEVVEQPPSYPGGDEARIRYLQDNMKYPAIARESGIQGIVYVTFVVERDGSIVNVSLLRGIGGGCDEEAMRVVKSMPRWIPGRQQGRAVNARFNLPVKFTLQ